MLSSKKSLIIYRFAITICTLLIFSGSIQFRETLAKGPEPKVNAPYFADQFASGQGAVFWFGQVDAANNHANVRIGYDDDQLAVVLHIFDRLLWYDTSPEASNLSEWDSVSLYLSLDGKIGDAPTTKTYRLVGQLSQSSNRTQYQTSDQGNGSNWMPASIPFTTTAGWRGDGLNNNNDDRGWLIYFKVPFSNLGSPVPPPKGSSWGLAIALHDRDAQTNTSIPDQFWPESANLQQPATWGELTFGEPIYTPPAVTTTQNTTIRHGLNGVTVSDAHVGGHSNCGQPYWPNYFDGWGNANYAGYSQINIQNQWDVADWPCFSKYYITFPLDTLPSNQAIISATLTMYHFGNSNPGKAKPSLIQASTVTDGWQESTIAWNNAPLAFENVAKSWVDPLPSFPGWPGIPQTWDVSRAVAKAYQSGEPLRLALYSSDGDYHSGKYFISSDGGFDSRPKLQVFSGETYGFTVTGTPSTQAIQPGETAHFTLEVTPDGGFTSPVSLTAQNPSANLQLSLSPQQVTSLPGQATVTITDTHPPASSSIHYKIPVEATAEDITQTIYVNLFIGATQTYLPIILRN